MGSEWKNTTLGEVVNFRRGHDLPKTKMTGGNIPVMGSNGVIGFHDTATSKAPGVTIGRSGNVGNPQLCEVDSWAHNTTLYVDDFKGNDPLFIFHFLKTLNLENFRGGSAVPTLNRNHIHPIDVTIPPLPEQKRIAHILGTLDDKIELNRKMNATLEAMAQALFKSWFVDFDPVIDNALRAGNPIPEPLQQRAETRRKILGERSSSCVTTSKDGAGAPSLPDPHSHLFPATFTHSEDLGWMPEG
ncbi:MAG: restriction endonuclease subunit S, partial [Rubritalea sp.]